MYDGYFGNSDSQRKSLAISFDLIQTFESNFKIRRPKHYPLRYYDVMSTSHIIAYGDPVGFNLVLELWKSYYKCLASELKRRL